MTEKEKNHNFMIFSLVDLNKVGITNRNEVLNGVNTRKKKQIASETIEKIGQKILQGQLETMRVGYLGKIILHYATWQIICDSRYGGRHKGSIRNEKIKYMILEVLTVKTEE